MRKQFLTLFVATILLAAESTAVLAQAVPDKKDNLHVFLLMGQSNMAGFAPVKEEDLIPAPGIFKIPTIQAGAIGWKPAAHPLHNRLPSDGFGLGIPFAQKYLINQRSASIGLVPLAYGGAGIDQLKKGSAVYDDFLKKLAYAQETGVIKGLLWHQGESDTVSDELADSYEQKLVTLIADIRSDVGNPQLPVVIGDLAEFYGTAKEHSEPDRVKRINKVRQALKHVAETIPNVGFVKCGECTSIDAHNVHFDRRSYIILGEKYFEAFALLGGLPH